MNTVLTEICSRFIDNLTLLRSTFKMEPSELYPVAAAQITGHGLTPSPDHLKEARHVLKQEAGILSNFRGNAGLSVICALVSSSDPKARMEESKAMYQYLKEEFFGSVYLAIASVLLPDLVQGAEAVPYIERGKRLYRLMKKEHPFLTSSEDSVLAVLLAFSEKSDETLLREMEAAYAHLKEQIRWSSSDSVQSVSHILSMDRRNALDSARRLHSLFEALERAGHRYGKNYQLTALATLAISDRDISSLVRDIAEANAFLAEQKYYRGPFGYARKTRLMHAAILVSLQEEFSAAPDAGILTSTLAMVAAQQAAMCAIIASSAASSAASSSH